MKKFLLICFFILLAPRTAAAFSLSDSFAGKTVGVQIGTSGDMLASEAESVNVERYNKLNDAIQSLLNKKIDAVLSDEAPASVFVNDNKQLYILQGGFEKEEYAIAIAKNNNALKEQINAALEKLKENKTLENIVKNYIGNDTVGKFPYVSPDGIQYDGVLKIATNATFPPYEFYDNGKITGIDVDIARAVGDLLGKKAVFEDMEFDAIIAAVHSGKAHIGVAGMTVTPERLKNINFSIPYTTSKQVVILRSSENTSSAGMTFADRFRRDFITDARWKYLSTGLLHTLVITVLSGVIGVIFGGLIAIVRVSHDKNGSFVPLNFLCRTYLTLIRGTPVMIQLLIMYYVVFSSVGIDKIFVAVLAFGLNSSAYVAEIIRSGIMSVDAGQFEAGRSLGLTFSQTMRFVVLPQAFKNVLPALANEFIVLLKETSVCGYIGLMDLTRGGDIIRSITYDAFLPLAAVALIYLTFVLALTSLTGRLEQRLKKNER